MLREAALFDNSLTRKGIWKGGELFPLMIWDDCRFAYSYCDWRRLSPMVSTDTTDSFCLITCNFLLILPWLSPLWAPPFCLLGVRSLGSLLALWWYKHWHNHMFSCGVGTMLKFFFFLLFQNIPFLPSPLLWENNLSWAVSCCLPWFLLLFQLPFQNIWSTKEVYTVHYHVKALTNLPSFLYPYVILCSFYT